MKNFLEIIGELKGRIKENSVEDVRGRQESGESFHLIDVREESEWAGGYIPGAVHIGRGILEPKIEKRIPERDSEIVLYCGSGARSLLAAESLKRMGYCNAVSMAGGMGAWKEAGYPIEGGN